jgi:hypothetical protein
MCVFEMALTPYHSLSMVWMVGIALISLFGPPEEMFEIWMRK